MFNKRGNLALFQIFILLVSIIAFSSLVCSSDAENVEINRGKDSTTVPGKSATPNPSESSTLSATLGIKDAPGKKAGGFFSFNTGGGADAILSGAQWALVAYGVVQMISPLFGWDDAKNKAYSKAVLGGVFTGKSLYTLFDTKGAWADWFGKETLGMTPGQFSFVAGVAVGAYIFYKTYKKESQETITFTCEPWQAPTKGEHCEKCNEQGLPCSEYQCRSLGQACELLNQGTDNEKCAWVGRNDVTYPVIKSWDNALLADYEYRPYDVVSPPDKGVIVWNKDSTTGCTKAFTPLTFGVTLDEPGQCKVDYLRKSNFEEMEFYLGGSNLFDYNHSQIMSLPGPSALQAANLTLENNGDYELYVRCQDANGNYNTANFVFKYCVEKGPDTTPPLIVSTNVLSGMPIAYNQTEIELKVYINEPAECKWSHLDQSYEKMEEEMTCSSSVLDINAQMLYECSTKLTGLKSMVSDEPFENNFYFRCKDKPLEEDGNVDSQSYEFVLLGTQPLVIDSVLPNGTIKDSTDTVKVTLKAKTSAGYKEGESACYYSDTGEDDNYIMFKDDEGFDQYEHSQDLWPSSGDYKYWIKCLDLGGNSDIETVEFSVESDSSAPIIVRAYKEETNLKLVTNEKATCVYDTVDCSYLFDDGTKTTRVDDTNHYTSWNTKTSFYIKCKDDYGNKPAPNLCSITVRAFNSL